MGDDIFSYKLSNLSRSNGGDSLSFYPLGEVVHHDKKVFALARGFREGSKYVDALSNKQ